jgi:small subunit ribosomal protein S8e
MGISRSSIHKRRKTGGRRNHWRKSRKYELGRPAAGTKLSSHTCVRLIRVRGGNIKYRALRLDHGNFSLGSEALTRKTRIFKVEYNASSNELKRTNTLVKGAIVAIDPSPFKQWYNKHYGVDLDKGAYHKTTDNKKHSNRVIRNLNHRINPQLEATIIAKKIICVHFKQTRTIWTS